MKAPSRSPSVFENLAKMAEEEPTLVASATISQPEQLVPKKAHSRSSQNRVSLIDRLSQPKPKRPVTPPPPPKKIKRKKPPPPPKILLETVTITLPPRTFAPNTPIESFVKE